MERSEEGVPPRGTVWKPSRPPDSWTHEKECKHGSEEVVSISQSVHRASHLLEVCEHAEGEGYSAGKVEIAEVHATEGEGRGRGRGDGGEQDAGFGGRPKTRHRKKRYSEA